MTRRAAKEGMEERNRKVARGNNSKKRERGGRGKLQREVRMYCRVRAMMKRGKLKVSETESREKTSQTL